MSSKQERQAESKLGNVAEAVAQVCQRTHVGYREQLRLIASYCDLSLRQLQSYLPKHLKELQDRLGVRIRYQQAEYAASGRGNFGRLKGGPRGRYHPAHLVVEGLIVSPAPVMGEFDLVGEAVYHEKD